METRGRTGLLTALAVAALALTSCVGIGAVGRGGVTAEAQRRGGGITAALVLDAVGAVQDETGVDPLQVHSITATLAVVAVVVPAADGSGGRDTWRHGTSGVYGGKGLDGPSASAERAEEPFAADAAGLEGLDASVDLARDATGLAGGWVESVTVARPAAGAAPLTTLLVTDGTARVPVVVDAEGALVPEASR